MIDVMPISGTPTFKEPGIFARAFSRQYLDQHNRIARQKGRRTEQ